MGYCAILLSIRSLVPIYLLAQRSAGQTHQIGNNANSHTLQLSFINGQRDGDGHGNK